MIPGIVNNDEFGNNFGSDQNETLLEVAFEGTGTDLQLSVTGYDIDLADEVAVYLNGALLGYLPVSANNSYTPGTILLIPASLQLPGINIVEFRQARPDETWGVTNLLLTPFPDVSLVVGSPETGEYGWGYGSRQHQLGLSAVFESTGADLQLSVTGYDIDLADEVAVYLNGQLLGYLSVGPDNGFNDGDVFPILLRQQVPGTNIVEFRQKVPGYKWGVTDLLLDTFQPDVTLTAGVPDTGAYGWGYGSRQHEAGLVAAFQGTGIDLQLSVTGYDIDLTDEVAVYLNGELLGYLSVGPDEGLNQGDVFLIRAAEQHDGTNIVEFQVAVPGYKWGITNLLIDEFLPDVTLTVGVMDTGAYGWGYGSRQHEAGLVAAFQNSGIDLQLSVTGYDIDLADEVAVYLNDELLGYLSVGPNNGLNSGDVFPIMLQQQRPGTNIVEFRQKVPGYKWGITNLLIDEFLPDVTLTVGVMDTGAYGWGYGSRQHEAGLVAAFQNSGIDLQLSVTGYDIDLADEVAVYLNGQLLGYLSVGPNNGFNSGDVFPIMLQQQRPGTNIVEFQVAVPGYKWGITNLLIDEFLPDVTLTVGVMDTGAYGWGYGSRQHEAGLTAGFEDGGRDVELSVTGYDIDLADEVGVYLNGELLGYLSVGPNNGLNGGDAFVILAYLLRPGTNIVEFRVAVPGYKWGVTNLLVSNY
jgi:ABC-type amino acid transport substrate-binding protein